MTTPASLGIAIVDWQAISPLGIGAQAFGESSMSLGTVAQHPLHVSASEFPQDIAYRPAYFETARLLGAKGIRTMDRTTALAVCTAKLLHGDRPTAEGAASERLGFVLGTSTGSIRSTSDFTRESLVQERPFLVNPALFPNTVMNCAAGQCGIWFKARAVNATISGGRLSGLLALKYAAQTLRRGYADRLFTGAVEEMCPQTAWAHRQLIRQGRRHDVPVGEGCAMFELERTADVLARGEQPTAEIMALQYGRYFDPLEPAMPPVQAAAECIVEALHRCGVAAEEVAICVLCSAADAGSSEIEREAAVRTLPASVELLGAEMVARVGDTYSATIALALGQLLVKLKGGKEPQIGIALTVCVDGHVGCLVVRA